ncbi:transporter substrate-binding domain-containing protein [Vibrio profundum]|uniref:substrate-binding periplasmic protein n=1 Tax=Vibrio profundum TaxID=2910247 RepID=UPI003D104891
MKKILKWNSIKKYLFFLLLFPVFSLSAEERVVRFVTVDWPPFFASSLPQQGYVSEVTKEALKRVGYKTTIDFVPWARALKMVQDGKADAVLGAYYTQERAAYSVYSDPIMKSSDSFFKKKGSSSPNSYTSLTDLKKYSIDYLRGSSYGESFDNADFLKKSKSKNIKQKLLKLDRGRVDLILSSEVIINYTIMKDLPEYQGKFVKLTPPLKTNMLFNMFSKKVDDHQEIAKAFNKGLNILKEDGTLSQLAEKHNIPLDSQL